MKLDKSMTLSKLKESVKNSLEHIKPEHYWNYFTYSYYKEHYKNEGPRTLLNKHPTKLYKPHRSKNLKKKNSIETCTIVRQD
jgi:hypothetical protein